MQLQVGNSYSNGAFGSNWSVRQVQVLDGDRVVYRVMVGKDRRKDFICSVQEFLAWARYRVALGDNGWNRID